MSPAAPVPSAPLPPKPPERRRLSRRMRDGLTVVGLALLAFAVGLTVFNNVIMPRLIHSNAEVRVPDLSNLSYDQAARILGPLQLRLGRVGERFDPSVPRGFILTQDPLPDTPLRMHRRVMVMVSLGEEFSPVPEMVGSSLRGAALTIEHAGLGLSGTTRAPAEELGEGMVVATDPPSGTVVPHNWPVGLLLSSGESEESFVMPNLLGRDRGAVKAQLEALGFRVHTTGRGGVVFVQNPAPGSRVTLGARIVIQAGGRGARR